MNKKIRVSSGAVWEDKVGYSRAVRVGNIIEISGTAAIDRDKIISPNNVQGQTKFIIQKQTRGAKAPTSPFQHGKQTQELQLATWRPREFTSSAG